MKKGFIVLLSILIVFVITSCQDTIEPVNPNVDVASLNKSKSGNIGINIVLNTKITDKILKELDKNGKVVDVFYEINAVRVLAKASLLSSIQALPFVESANPDAERNAPPFNILAVENFNNGLSTWNLDAINVTDFGFGNRQVPYDGDGVYIGLLDTGLLSDWPLYFPADRIATNYAKSFGGGGAVGTNVSEQPNKWERDVNSHGTHVTSIILGYSLGGTPVNGVAPMANVIPVKVLNQNGSGWSSVIARGIMYIAELKEGPLSDYPVVINMSLGGPELDAMEKAAIDYAITAGVIVVASAGNEGEEGMGYPGAYEPVISVAAAGWVNEWASSSWWWSIDVTEPTDPEDFYITDFSSRQLAGQDLDVAAPGSWVVGPYQVNMGQISYYYLGGTSQAAPHVTGIVALMAQKDPALIASDAENILEDSALPLSAGSMNVFNPNTGIVENIVWGADATGAGLVQADAALAATP